MKLTQITCRDECEWTSLFLATIRKPLFTLRLFDCCVIKCQVISSWHLEVSWSRYLSTSSANQIAAF